MVSDPCYVAGPALPTSCHAFEQKTKTSLVRVGVVSSAQ